MSTLASKLVSRKLFVAVGSLLTVVFAPASTVQQIAVAAIAAAYVLAQALVDRATVNQVLVDSGIMRGSESSDE
jgi:parvulin-like peptidyl-prolyl isomerase